MSDRRRHHRHDLQLQRAAANVSTVLEEGSFSAQIFMFRGRRGDITKFRWWTGSSGLCLLAKQLELGRFIRRRLATIRWR
ncbi:IS66 family insertion sequence element accessory protein TnpB [Duganella zoogloeoides]|uniref:IS66 family insertion sequence element accessory protein TnpB n=1 Tax=Duganella zoogloeoides TaxID=75659 RepID=UPI003898F270